MVVQKMNQTILNTKKSHSNFMNKALHLLMLLAFFAEQINAQTIVNITDADIQANQTVNWTGIQTN